MLVPLPTPEPEEPVPLDDPVRLPEEPDEEPPVKLPPLLPVEPLGLPDCAGANPTTRSTSPPAMNADRPARRTATPHFENPAHHPVDSRPRIGQNNTIL